MHLLKQLGPSEIYSRISIMPPKAYMPRSYPSHDPGTLAGLWEQQQSIRNRLLTEPHFTRWLNDDALGVKSVKAMSLNHVALEVMAEHLCPQSPYVLSAKIGFCRSEVRGFQSVDFSCNLGS